LKAEKTRRSGDGGALLAWGAVGFFVYALFSKARALQTMNLYPAGVQDIYFDGPTPVIRLVLRAQNSSSQSLTINSIAANLYANGYLVGNMGSFLPQPIAPNSESELVVNVRLNPLGIVNDIIRAVQFGSFTQDLNFRGYANINNYQLPVDMTFKAGAH
jgi:hypothetical protein